MFLGEFQNHSLGYPKSRENEGNWTPRTSDLYVARCNVYPVNSLKPSGATLLTIITKLRIPPIQNKGGTMGFSWYMTIEIS